MRKILVIAMREFNAAVKSKAFVVSLVLMPLLMFGGMIVQRAAGRLGDVKTHRVAIVDRTPQGSIFGPLQQQIEARNKIQAFDAKTGKQIAAKIELERIEPAPTEDENAVRAQRFELSDRVRRDELFAIVEIGRDVLKPSGMPSTLAVRAATQMSELSLLEQERLSNEVAPEAERIEYSTNRPTNRDVRGFLEQSIPMIIHKQRLELAGVPPEKTQGLMQRVRVTTGALWRKDNSGAITQAARESMLATFFIPLILLMLMFMIVMVGASPLTTNLVEEKQLRIAEVLLGSVTPFQLMMGKLIGGVGVALTLAAIYFGGAYVVAMKFRVADMVTPSVIAWFLVFSVLGTFMFGAMFLAAGAAVTNVKEAQTMITPVILLIVLPMFVLNNILKDPNGMLATVGSFFPISAPLVTVARLGVPPGVPVWQVVVSAVVTLVTTIAIIWAAGRIFRVGILMQGQGAKMGEMLKWIVRG